MAIEMGQSHQERQQKHGTRTQQELARREDELPPELDRRAKSTDPAPTEKAAQAERERHARQGTRGGNP
ncbi:MAG TPA: hypothetical protein VIA18_00590 [Polyangia bacterium]|nr:hypothetical protein [Polyangia bacterium]HWE31121.1 hypothetical protein [Polyangia bacterium]